jgi:hypothetical protein
VWYSSQRILNLRDRPCRCKKTAFIGIAYYTFIGMVAQIVLAQRSYVSSGINIRLLTLAPTELTR